MNLRTLLKKGSHNYDEQAFSFGQTPSRKKSHSFELKVNYGDCIKIVALDKKFLKKEELDQISIFPIRDIKWDIINADMLNHKITNHQQIEVESTRQRAVIYLIVASLSTLIITVLIVVLVT